MCDTLSHAACINILGKGSQNPQKFTGLVILENLVATNMSVTVIMHGRTTLVDYYIVTVV